MNKSRKEVVTLDLSQVASNQILQRHSERKKVLAPAKGTKHFNRICFFSE